MFALAFTHANGEQRQVEYKVEEHSLAQWWYAAFKKRTLSDLRPTHKVMSGFDTELSPHLARLEQLVDALNEFVPDKIAVRFDHARPRESLNALHIHFPLGMVSHQNALICEYNDLIHFIEDILIKRDSSTTNERVMLCFMEHDRRAIAATEFQHFTITRNFGDCFAHYPHVGRHPLEIYFADDVFIPNDQILPMSEVTASCSFRFGTPMYAVGVDFVKGRIDIERFFNRFGKHRLPYPWGDPRLAIGYPLVATLAHPVPDQAAFRSWLAQATLTDILH
jgi:hypothetical protein